MANVGGDRWAEGECRKMLEQMRRDLRDTLARCCLRILPRLLLTSTLPVNLDPKDLRGGFIQYPTSNNLSRNPAECLEINLDTNFFVKRMWKSFIGNAGE